MSDDTGFQESMPEELKLDNQLCFPLYAASRLVTRLYKTAWSRWVLLTPSTSY